MTENDGFLLLKYGWLIHFCHCPILVTEERSYTGAYSQSSSVHPRKVLMDPFMWAFSGYKNRCEFNHESVSSSDSSVVKGFQLIDTSLDHDIVDLPLNSAIPHPVIRCTDAYKGLDRDSAEENDLSSAVLGYINKVLMEDDWEDKACTIQESNLHAAEKSFYEMLGKKHPSLPNQPLPHEDAGISSDGSITHCCSNFSGSYINADDSVESGITSDLHKHKSSHVHYPYVDHTLLSNSQSFCSPSCSCRSVAGLVESVGNAPLESLSSWWFNVGREETKKILPSCNDGTFDFENIYTPLVAKEKVLKVKAKPEKDEGDVPDSLLTGRKSLHREGSDFEEGRNNKHLAVYAEESLLHELFDKVLSLFGKSDEPALDTHVGVLPIGVSGELQHNDLAEWSNGEMTYIKKGVSKREAVDMRSLLIQCMQYVAGNDHRSASQLLNEIRSRSSPLGDGYQRLAHYFADSLEARLLGGGRLEHKALVAKSMSDADILKAYKLYLSAFPFTETSFFFSNQTIMELVEKATTLHIIDFGIMYGLQWPPLIQCLSTRRGGPPKLRITGIDLPQAGFRPAARVNETGGRLANYCERFNVPFEYNGIAKEWATLSVEDLRFEEDEVLVVNSLYKFMYLLDDTIMEYCPRDAVLNFIKRISPDIFIHGVVHGTYNSPFFVSRFREALFHFSALFDMFEAYVPRESQARMVFERDMWGKLILNVIACEGLNRVARPETYKQWQIRTLRAGFRQIPLNQEITKKVKAKEKSRYHKYFFVDEAGQWMLQGWKGRVLFALSCWRPT